MESQNSVELTNGVNGTAHLTDDEHPTIIETKAIPSDQQVIEPRSVSDVQQVVHESDVVAAPQEVQQPAVEAEPIQLAAVEVEPVQLPAVVAEPVQEAAVVAEPVQEAAVEAEPVQEAAVEAAPVQLLAVEAEPVQLPAVVAEPVQESAEVIVAAPQVINGGSEFTREVKDVTGITVPGVFPGTTFNIQPFVVDALNQVAQAQGFTDYSIEYDRGSSHGDGFVAEIVRAVIKGNQLIKGVPVESELVLIVKLPPDNKVRREQMGMNVFEREVLVYNEILPLFQQFQLDKGLKPGQGFVSFPKCYFASFDKEKEEAIIIMEDIRKKGFKMQSKFKPVDFPHAKAVLETMAEFHGISMAMKDQRPEVFEKFKGLQDILAEGMVNDLMKTMTESSCQKAMGTLGPNEENIKQKLQAFSDNIIEIVKTTTNGELAEPYSVLNHGDCWINNMMFKYQSGFPRHLCLLDWQILRYASPVLDICYFLYLCTDSALRAQHFDNLIQAYHISLRKQVELLGSDVNQIFPFTALLREMKSRAKYALSTALFVIPMLCMPNAELPNMDELAESIKSGDINDDPQMFKMSSNTESLYNKRMGGVIRDMIKKGYL